MRVAIESAMLLYRLGVWQVCCNRLGLKRAHLYDICMHLHGFRTIALRIYARRTAKVSIRTKNPLDLYTCPICVVLDKSYISELPISELPGSELPISELHAHIGLLQKKKKRLEEDLCWIVPRVPPTIQSAKGLNWTELNWWNHNFWTQGWAEEESSPASRLLTKPSALTARPNRIALGACIKPYTHTAAEASKLNCHNPTGFTDPSRAVVRS